MKRYFLMFVLAPLAVAGQLAIINHAHTVFTQRSVQCECVECTCDPCFCENGVFACRCCQ